MSVIPDKDFCLLWSEALVAPDCDRYLSEFSGSSIWGAAETITDDDIAAILSKLSSIWSVAHMTVKNICEAAGLRQIDLQRRYCIHRNTVNSWWTGKRACPDHYRLMLAELLGVLDRAL